MPGKCSKYHQSVLQSPTPPSNAAVPRMSGAGSSGQPVNLFDSVVECLDYLGSVEASDEHSKQDVVDSVRMRMNYLVGRIITNQHCTSMGPQGWTRVTTKINSVPGDT
mmetsp:Transcript_15243/g.38268  ORF Transcript_15243/g.38268 Transcript_15243/m.38268 type:complete len:108 (+) Transcript_15243:35-358(+)